MQINLREEMEEHLQRLKTLSDDALGDEDESYSSRAAALTALSKLLKQLTQDMQEIINMERLQQVEQSIIEVFDETADDQQKAMFIRKLKELSTKTDNNAGEIAEKMQKLADEEAEMEIVDLDSEEIIEL